MNKVAIADHNGAIRSGHNVLAQHDCKGPLMNWVEDRAMPTLQLSPVLDLAAAELLHRVLQGGAGQDANVVLDGSQVTRVSTACLQLIVAASRSARGRGTGFALEPSSPVLTAALSDLGLLAGLNHAGLNHAGVA